MSNTSLSSTYTLNIFITIQHAYSSLMSVLNNLKNIFWECI
uniref:Uncharacterized protein n=1 Tax=Anguilla anguilla TaxID=7936 RepID=A0A0E9PT08_ANGAN